MLGGWSARIILIVVGVSLWEFPIFMYSIFSPSSEIKILGILICLLGMLFAVWARRTLGLNWSANPIELKENHELVSSGPYRLVRNPIYTGVMFALLGTFIGEGQLRVFLLFVLIAIGMIVRTRIEGKLMAQQFPESYPEYKKKVKSLIPWII
jgi:protein-S-isoprenylcysteine O-methyltransferase